MVQILANAIIIRQEYTAEMKENISNMYGTTSMKDGYLQSPELIEVLRWPEQCQQSSIITKLHEQ